MALIADFLRQQHAPTPVAGYVVAAYDRQDHPDGLTHASLLDRDQAEAEQRALVRRVDGRTYRVCEVRTV